MLLFSAATVHADGFILRLLDTAFVPETDQLAEIHYRDGKEQLMVNVGASQDFPVGLWLFPVPAAPEQVELDVVKHKYLFLGREVRDAAAERFKNAKELILGSQLYPLLFPHYKDSLPFQCRCRSPSFRTSPSRASSS